MENQISNNSEDQPQPEDFARKLREYLQDALVNANRINGPDISLEEFEMFRAAPPVTEDKVKILGSQFHLFITSIEGKEYLADVINCVQQLINEKGKSTKSISVDDIDELLNKAISRMHRNEEEKEKQAVLQQKQRINSTVKTTIAGALKNIKPWEGLS